jgi:uncharacterized cupredoxin-like copper-binding protein
VTEERTHRPARPWRRAAPWLLAAVFLSALGLPAVGGAFGHLPAIPVVGYARPAADPPLTINLTDTPRFTPAYVSVPSGSSVTFHLVNQGSFTHSFTLLARAGFVLPTNWTPAQVDQWVANNGSLANVSLAGGAQSNASVAFNASTAFDSFEFISLVPYQFQAGMYGFVNVTSSAPGLVTSDNTTDSYTFAPDILAANATHYPFNLDVLVTNTGNLGHTFTVASQTNVTVPLSFDGYFAANPPLVSAQVPGGAGSAVWANFTVPGPGVYQFICTIQGHYQNGMSGELYVGVQVPPQPAAPSTAVIQGWILVGSGVLLGVGILLAATTAYMGRFPPPTESSEHHH